MESIDEMLATWVDADRPAVIFEGVEISYQDLSRGVEAMAAGLWSQGVGRGDRVAICGLNRVEMLEALLACARLGAMLTPVNNRLTAAEVAVHLADAEPSILLGTDGFHDLLSEADARSDRGEPLAVIDLDSTPLTGFEAPVPARAGSLSDPVLIVYTSGTTGKPKGAVLTQNALLRTWENGLAYQSLDSSSVTVAPLPMFHVGGLNIQTLPTLLVGGTVILQRRFSPEDFLRATVERSPTHTLLVPAMLRAVSGHPTFEATDLSSFVSVSTGSSIVPEEVMRPFFDRGLPVCQVYGTTETGPTSVVLGNDEAVARVGSCGTAARHSQMKVVDESGEPAAAGEAGEVWLRGDNLFSHYWRKAAATERAFVDGWYRTGDIGHLDADGYLTIIDRLGDMIISGGENVYPSEVEAVLIEHPSITEVAVIGRLDERWGETPVAVIVAAPDVDPTDLTVEVVRAWCADRLTRFKQPTAVVLVDDLPRTSLGKVRKHALR